MEYIKVRFDFLYTERGRFYRTFLVKEDTNLNALCVAFLKSVHSDFDHIYQIIDKKKKRYYAFYPEYDEERDLSKSHLHQLSDSFIFEYDMGDGWKFKTHQFKKKVECDSSKSIILIDGKGQCIFEDNIRGLCAYLAGRVDGDCTDEDILPCNYAFSKISDFDLPLDIEALNNIISK